jgi:hypothetical protein
VNGSPGLDRLLRWYPPKWRDRYGQELLALLEDTYASRRVPWPVRLSLMRNGALEQVREVGLVGNAISAQERMRAGSLMIVCCWSLFLVAGAIFAKFSEHWDAATPLAGRHLASAGYATVKWSGEAGVALVVAAAVLVVPSFVKFVRGGGWSVIGRSVMRTLSLGLVLGITTTGLAVWAHHLNSPQRNGGLVIYTVAFFLWGLSVVILIGSSTATIVAVTRAMALSRRVTRSGTMIAVTLTIIMVMVATGTATWWVAEARYAPAVLRGPDAGGFLGAPSVLPPALLLVGVLMVLGLAVAVAGVVRVSRALADH